jgi:hypothetical protein
VKSADYGQMPGSGLSLTLPSSRGREGFVGLQSSPFQFGLEMPGAMGTSRPTNDGCQSDFHDLVFEAL